MTSPGTESSYPRPAPIWWGCQSDGGGDLELAKPAHEPASSRSKPCASLKKAPRILPVHRSLSALVGRKQTVVRNKLFPQKPPGSRLLFLRTGVQHSPDSSTIELPSTFAESGAYPPDGALPGSPRQGSLPLTCRHLPKGTKLELGT